MQFWGWVSQNWFDLISGISMLGGLVGIWFAYVALKEETKARRIGNLITLTNNHRELMQAFYRDGSVSRVLDATANITSAPVSQAEEMYLKSLIQHISCTYWTMQSDLTVKPDKVREDVRELMALPIPKFVWGKVRRFQDKDFISFVEGEPELR